MTLGATLDPVLTRPLYTLREAAAIVGVPSSTLHSWARGRSYKGTDGAQHRSDAIITTTGTGRREVVPFLGLAEAYVLAAFRAAGVPMQRIRPALAHLEEEIGVAAALTSERLKTDGAEVLWEYQGEGGDDEIVNDLVIVRNQQIVFRDVVEQYLKTITYRSGRVAVIGLPQYRTDVVVDPLRNFGRPMLASRAIRVQDIVGRVEAGELIGEVALDYGLDPDEVRALVAA
ncbi:DUF433 domain-containing protein [Georgenia sp. MJ173]|uniref:DUF433 domain-containing protein n=1 Tax=Georgenia sunbinii TaxID=3117728 RepID=UPI002F25F538